MKRIAGLSAVLFVVLVLTGFASGARGLRLPVAASSRGAADRHPACLNANKPGLRELKPSVRPVPSSTPGKVLAGRKLVSQMPYRRPVQDSDPFFAHYPKGVFRWPPTWLNTGGLAPSSLIYAANADAVFNGDYARYRIAFNQAFYGVDPTNIGDFNGDHVDDLAIPDHYAYVDGGYEAGQVDLYYGRRGYEINPRHDVPDVIVYGDEAGGALGISVASAGDVNGDGYDDILIAAAYHSVPLPHGGRAYLAGKVYLLYGGYVNEYRCPVKVRVQQIGRRIPGIVFYGGPRGGYYLGYANEMDSGRFSRHGLSDIVIGSYNPFPHEGPSFPARAYLVYGSRHLPRRFVGYRLGVYHDRNGIRTTEYTLPRESLTQESLGFSASFVGDLTGDGHDDLAFAAGMAGPNQDGEAFVFFKPPSRRRVKVPIESAPLTIYADSETDPPLAFEGIESIRPNGDIYGDGHQDAVLVARYSRGFAEGQWAHVGAVGVLHGRAHFPRRLGFSQLDTILYGTQPGEIGQPSMATGTDLNGDGCSDLLINDATYFESIGSSTQYRGRMWLVLGRPNLPHVIPLQSDANRTILADTRIPGLFGFNWATGDWASDGRPALIIADHYAGDREHQLFVGRDYLFYNHSLHLRFGQPDGC